MALLAGDVWSCSQAGRSRNIRSAPAKVAGSVKPKPDHLEMVVATQGRVDPCEIPWLRSGSARRRRGLLHQRVPTLPGAARDQDSHRSSPRRPKVK